MKRSIFVLLGLIVLGNGCKIADSTTNVFTPDEHKDRACRRAIQSLYSMETYCPNNLTALQDLFTDEYNSKNKLSLDRCSQVSSYKVLKLLSEKDPDFPDSPDDPKPMDVIEYFAEVEIQSKSGNTLGNDPGSIWLHMKMDDSGACKIDDIHGGG